MGPMLKPITIAWSSLMIRVHIVIYSFSSESNCGGFKICASFIAFNAMLTEEVELNCT
jgi:hypothetical protein